MSMMKKEKIRYDGAKPLGILPYLIMLSVSLMYILCRQQMLVCTVAMCVACCGLYMAVYVLRKKPLGATIVTLVMVGMCMASMLMVGVSFFDFIGITSVGKPAAFEEGGFIHFLFTASMTFDPINAATAILIFSVVFGFLGCYFTAVLPRPCFLLVLMFVPFILSSRTGGGLPLWLTIPTIGAYMAAVFCSAKKCESSDTVVVNDAEGFQMVGAGVLAAIVITGAVTLLPRSTETPAKEIIDTIISRTGGFSTMNAALTNFKNNSAVNTGENDPSDNLLFTVQTDTPMFIDRWVFDVYNGERGWTILKEYNTGYPTWAEQEKLRRVPDLLAALKQGAEEGLLAEYADIITELPEQELNTGKMYIRVMDGSSTSVVLHPLGTYGVDIANYSGKLYRTPKGEIFTEDNVTGASYLLTYKADAPDFEYIAAVEEIGFENLLTAAARDDVMTEARASVYFDELEHAEDYRRKTGTYGVSEKLFRLALQITDGCETDLHKAMALESWFGEQGFLYDMAFVPEELTADYFVTESRRGICSDFATAMTLMARAAGLPARYTEGFALTEDIRDSNGVYRVTGENAHAYCQVYIEGFGWISFDPTRYVKVVEADTSPWLMPLIIVILSVIALMLAGYLLRNQLRGVWLAVSYPMRSYNSRVRGVYLEARRLACAISGREEQSLSSGEVEKILTNTLSMPSEAEEIRAAADELLYSGEDKGGADTKSLYGCLKRLRRQKRRLGR